MSLGLLHLLIPSTVSLIQVNAQYSKASKLKVGNNSFMTVATYSATRQTVVRMGAHAFRSMNVCKSLL